MKLFDQIISFFLFAAAASGAHAEQTKLMLANSAFRYYAAWKQSAAAFATADGIKSFLVAEDSVYNSPIVIK